MRSVSENYSSVHRSCNDGNRVTGHAVKIIASILPLAVFFISLLSEGCGTAKVQQKAGGGGRDTLPHYLVIGLTDAGISILNTKTNSLEVLAHGEADDDYLVSSVCPSGNKIAYAFYDAGKKESSVFVYSAETGKNYWAKKNKGKIAFNLLWMNDSLLFVNAYERKVSAKSGNLILDKAYTELINVNDDKVVKGFKPRNGYVLEAFLQNKYAVYSDTYGFHYIDWQTNRIIHTLSRFTTQKKKDIAYSPNGKYMLFCEKIKNASRDTVSELLLADFKGDDEKIILTREYDPRCIQWSKNSDIIYCTIASREHPGVRNIASQEVLTHKTSFKTEESFGKVFSFSSLRVSPSGNLMFYVSKTDGAEEYHLAVRQLRTGRDFPIRESGCLRVNAGTVPAEWQEENEILFHHPSAGYSVYNLVDNVCTPLPEPFQKIILVKRLD